MSKKDCGSCSMLYVNMVDGKEVWCCKHIGKKIKNIRNKNECVK